MEFTTKIRVVLKDEHIPLNGVTVTLFDKDTRTQDDLLGEGRTDERGEITFRYNVRRFAPDELLDRRTMTSMQPELYIVIKDAQGKPVFDTKKSIAVDKAVPMILVPFDLAFARKVGLVGTKPIRTPDEKMRTWKEHWTKRRASQDPGPGIDLCIARMALETVVKLDKPKTDVQKQVAKYAKQHFNSTQLTDAQKLAQSALNFVDSTRLLENTTCTGDLGIAKLIEKIFGPNDPSNPLFKSLPDPTAGLGAPKPGTPFGYDIVWDKMCKHDFETGHLTDPAKGEMAELIQNDRQILRKPSVNLIQVWDSNPLLRDYVRVGKVHDKKLIIHDFDPQTFSDLNSQTLNDLNGQDIWRTKTLELNKSLNDPECLVKVADDTGNQAFFIDVKPGQKLRFLGSGFVSAQAKIHVSYQSWANHDNGRLVPDTARLPVPGFNGSAIDVYGQNMDPLPGDTAKTFLGDVMILEWPGIASAEGLYTIKFEFENQTDFFSAVEQKPHPDCGIKTNMDNVFSLPVYVAVLPPVVPQRVRIEATQVHCVDETEPENLLFVNLADDVLCQVSGTLTRVFLNTNTNLPDDEIAQTVTRDASRLIWNDDVIWDTNLQAWPEQGPHQRLNLDEMVTVTLALFEVEGDHDRAMVRTVLVIALVLTIVAIIAIMLAVIVGLFIAGYITEGVTIALIGVALVIAEFLIAAAFTAGMAAIEAIVAQVRGSDLIGDAMTMFSGMELGSRLSPYRIHRALYLHDRPNPGESQSAATRITSTIEDHAIREVYQANNLGGEYRFTIECASV